MLDLRGLDRLAVCQDIAHRYYCSTDLQYNLEESSFQAIDPDGLGLEGANHCAEHLWVLQRRADRLHLSCAVSA